MAKGGKLSFKSIVDCFKSAKSDSDRVSCKKYFAKKYKPEDDTPSDKWYAAEEKDRKEIDKRSRDIPSSMNDKESKVWSKYIGQGSLARSRMDKNEKTILDSLIKDKLKRLED